MYRRLEVVDRQLEEAGLTHWKNQEMMLRRLANGGDAHPLRLLAGAVEPLTGYDRHKVGITYTWYSPFTRMVDAAVADPRPAREFSRRVDRSLGGEGGNVLEVLTGQLSHWKENHSEIKALVDRSPMLQEIEPLLRSPVGHSGAGPRSGGYSDGKKGIPGRPGATRRKSSSKKPNRSGASSNWPFSRRLKKLVESASERIV